jgi:hypothetical protein
MEKKERVRELIEKLALEVFDFIKASEDLYPERWVPAADIKRKLGLSLVAVPVANTIQRGEKDGFLRVWHDCLRIEGSLNTGRMRAAERTIARDSVDHLRRSFSRRQQQFVW